MEHFQAIALHLLPALGVIASGVGSVLAVWLARLVARKLKIEITAEQESELRALAEQGVGYAEQWGRKKLKAEGFHASGAAKLDEALAFVQREAERRKLPQRARDELVDLLEAELGVARMKSGAPPAPDGSLPPLEFEPTRVERMPHR